MCIGDVKWALSKITIGQFAEAKLLLDWLNFVLSPLVMLHCKKAIQR